MTTWFTSDWHLGHRNVVTLGEGRPFASIEEHDEALIARHNALVSPDDLVWVLGDVAMGDITASLAKCARMNGRKILICGNHDRTDIGSRAGRHANDSAQLEGQARHPASSRQPCRPRSPRA